MSLADTAWEALECVTSVLENYFFSQGQNEWTQKQTENLRE